MYDSVYVTRLLSSSTLTWKEGFKVTRYAATIVLYISLFFYRSWHNICKSHVYLTMYRALQWLVSGLSVGEVMGSIPEELTTSTILRNMVFWEEIVGKPYIEIHIQTSKIWKFSRTVGVINFLPYYIYKQYNTSLNNFN